MANKAAAEAVPDPGRQIYLDEARLRIDAALGAEIGFAERLVWFWSNHFCISADKIRRWPAPTSARRSGLTCPAGSPTCCWPPKAIRPCCSISTDRFAGRRLDRRYQPHEGPQRKPRPRDSGIAYARRADRLHPGRRDNFANVLTGWTLLPQGDNPEHGGEFEFQPATARARRPESAGQAYDARERGARPRRARDLAPIPRRQRTSPASWRDISSPTTAARHWSSGWRGHFAIPAATSRRSPKRW